MLLLVEWKLREVRKEIFVLMASLSSNVLATKPRTLSFRRSNLDRLGYLSEVTIEPEQINPTSLPLKNPYSTFVKISYSLLHIISP